MEYRSGKWKNNLLGELSYQSFELTMLPPDNPPIELDKEMIDLLVKANKQVALLDGISSRLPNVSLFIFLHIRKEALTSSQIEGTRATLDDILDPFIEENANQNVSDVINNIKATEFAIDKLKEFPHCNKLIRETHAVLMEGVRSQEKNPGEFRCSQNWIDGQGCSTLKDARYIPPNVEDMNGAMYALEKLFNHEWLWRDLDVLIQTALIHYQFETIHPFLKGNGCIGRLLIALYLMERKTLTAPILYISYFFNKNRTEYYDRMMEVRLKGHYEQWIKFFLLAVYETAIDAIKNIDKLTELHSYNMTFLNMKSVPNSVLRVFEYLEKHPIIEIGKTAKSLGLSYNTVSNAIHVLMDSKILIQSSGKQRGRIFSYENYLNILRSGT